MLQRYKTQDSLCRRDQLQGYTSGRKLLSGIPAMMEPSGYWYSNETAKLVTSGFCSIPCSQLQCDMAVLGIVGIQLLRFHGDEACSE